MDLPPQAPQAQGLYDPRNEHDSCGVGFVANIKGLKSHDIVRQGLKILVNLDHRGAVGADPLVGDGAGCMIQIPDKLLRAWAANVGRALPEPGRYAVAMCFLPQDEACRAFAVRRFEHFIKLEGQVLIAWRITGIWSITALPRPFTSVGTSRQPISTWPSSLMKCSKRRTAKARHASSCGRKHIATA